MITRTERIRIIPSATMADDVTPTSGTAEIKQMLLNAYKKTDANHPLKAEVNHGSTPASCSTGCDGSEVRDVLEYTLEWTTGEFEHVSDNEFALILEGLLESFTALKSSTKTSSQSASCSSRRCAPH